MPMEVRSACSRDGQTDGLQGAEWAKSPRVGHLQFLRPTAYGLRGAIHTLFQTPHTAPMLEPSLIAELMLLGLCTGFLAGLLGIGGGMLLGPFLTLILSHRGVSADLAVKMAIATSMATIAFTSLASVRAHHRRGSVRWDIVKRLAPGIVFGGALASVGMFSILKGTWLAVFFGLFVSVSATQMLRNKTPLASREMPGPVGQLTAGGLIGFLSGLVGAGGAFVSVPFMVSRNVPMRNAVGTSAALGFPVALANTLGYIISGSALIGLPKGALGYVWLPALGVIGACSVLTAPLGAGVAHRVPVAQLKRIFAVLLYGLAAYMLYKGLTA